MVKIAVDALGSDASLEEVCKGIYESSKLANDLEMIVFGPKEEIESFINKFALGQTVNNIKVIDASYAIKNTEDPLLAMRQGNSSLGNAYKFLKENDDVKGLVTAGATGAIIVGAILNLNIVKFNDEICKPCLAALMPNKNGNMYCVLDCGANTDCNAIDLLNFGKLGNAFAKSYLNIESPRIGLISNGREDTKGNKLTKEAFPLLKNSGMNFVGNIEGTAITENIADVIVCDGFSGNIVLKNMEGTAKTIIKDLVVEMKTAKAKGDEVTAKVLGKSINQLISKFDFNNLGGATLLGVNKIVVKGHGSATAETFINIVKQAYVMIKNDYLGSIYNQ